MSKKKTANAREAVLARKRDVTDSYMTPPECTEALLKYLELPRGTSVWEPAVGNGGIKDVLVEHGLVCTGTDIRTGTDFLECDGMPGTQDWIITNPPWAKAEDFIRKASTMGVPFAMLLKTGFWQTRSHTELFAHHRPAYILAMNWRPEFLSQPHGTGAPYLDCCWTVWGEQLRKKNCWRTVYDLLLRP